MTLWSLYIMLPGPIGRDRERGTPLKPLTRKEPESRRSKVPNSGFASAGTCGSRQLPFTKTCGRVRRGFCTPESPSTQYLRFLVPKTILLMVFGTRVLKYWILGPLGTECRLRATPFACRHLDASICLSAFPALSKALLPDVHAKEALQFSVIVSRRNCGIELESSALRCLQVRKGAIVELGPKARTTIWLCGPFCKMVPELDALS